MARLKMVSPLHHYYKCGGTRLWWSLYEAATCPKQSASLGPITISTSHSISAMQPPYKAARLEPSFCVSFNDPLCVVTCVFSASVHPSADVSDGESPTCDECKDIPLTILPSLEWEEAAVEMFKVCTHRHTYTWTHAHSYNTNIFTQHVQLK